MRSRIPVGSQEARTASLQAVLTSGCATGSAAERWAYGGLLLPATLRLGFGDLCARWNCRREGLLAPGKFHTPDQDYQVLGHTC